MGSSCQHLKSLFCLCLGPDWWMRNSRLGIPQNQRRMARKHKKGMGRAGTLLDGNPGNGGAPFFLGNLNPDGSHSKRSPSLAGHLDPVRSSPHHSNMDTLYGFLCTFARNQPRGAIILTTSDISPWPALGGLPKGLKGGSFYLIYRYIEKNLYSLVK